MMELIRPHLWLGNAADALNYKLLDESGIRAVLNVARDLQVPNYDALRQSGMPNKIYQHKVGLIDGPGNPNQLFRAAVMVLAGLVESDRTCLIHCHEGRSRSPCVVASYLAEREQRNFDDVLAELKTLRPIVRPEQGMLELAQKLTFPPGSPI